LEFLTWFKGKINYFLLKNLYCEFVWKINYSVSTPIKYLKKCLWDVRGDNKTVACTEVKLLKNPEKVGAFWKMQQTEETEQYQGGRANLQNINLTDCTDNAGGPSYIRLCISPENGIAEHRSGGRCRKQWRSLKRIMGGPS
jgi:hypothetical protein